MIKNDVTEARNRNFDMITLPIRNVPNSGPQSPAITHDHDGLRSPFTILAVALIVG